MRGWRSGCRFMVFFPLCLLIHCDVYFTSSVSDCEQCQLVKVKLLFKVNEKCRDVGGIILISLKKNDQDEERERSSV